MREKKFYLDLRIRNVLGDCMDIAISYRLECGLLWVNQLQMLKYDDTEAYKRYLEIGVEFKNNYIISEPACRNENELEQVIDDIKFVLNKYKQHIKI